MVVNSEAIARAHMVESGVARAGGAARPEVAGLVARYREHAAADEHPLRVVAEGPINKDVLNSLIDANTQTRDAGGGVTELNPGLNTRVKNVAEQLARIQKGELTDLSTLAGDLGIKAALESVIYRNPDLMRVYDGFRNDADRLAYRLNLLKKPNTAAEISRLLQERAGPDKLITDDVEELRIEGARLTQERNTLTTERGTLDSTVTTSENELREYQTRVEFVGAPPVPQTIQGRFVTELARLESSAEPLRQDCEILRSQITKIQEEIQTARAGHVGLLSHPSVDTSTPAGLSKISGLTTEVSSLETRLELRKKDLRTKTENLQQHEQRINSINARKTAVEEAVATAKTRIAEIDIKLAENGPKYAENQSKLHNAETGRKLKENEFASKLESILTESVASTINAELDVLVEHQIAIETTARDNARSESERQLREGVLAMFRNAAGDINWGAFRGGWAQFLLNGPDAMIEAHLAAHPVAGLTMDQLRANTDLYNTIISDFNTKMGRLRMSQPREGTLAGMRNRLLGPTPLTETEIRSVVDRMGDDYFDQMLASNAKLKEHIAQAAGQGSVEGHRSSQLLRKLPLKTLGMILMLLFGGTIFAAGKI